MLPDLRDWIEYRFNLKNESKHDASKADKIIGHLATLFFLLGLVIPLLQLYQFGQIFDAGDLIFKAGFLGLIPAILLLILFKKISPTIYDNAQRRYYVVLIFLFSFITISATFASSVNFQYADDDATCSYYEILDLEKAKRKRH